MLNKYINEYLLILIDGLEDWLYIFQLIDIYYYEFFFFLYKIIYYIIFILLFFF